MEFAVGLTMCHNVTIEAAKVCLADGYLEFYETASKGWSDSDPIASFAPGAWSYFARVAPEIDKED